MNDDHHDYTPDLERTIRRALRDAHNTDLINEAHRVIGREKRELRGRLIGFGARDSLIDSVMAHYTGNGAGYGWERRDLLKRLLKAAARRQKEAA